MIKEKILMCIKFYTRRVFQAMSNTAPVILAEIEDFYNFGICSDICYMVHVFVKLNYESVAPSESKLDGVAPLIADPPPLKLHQ